MAQTVKNLLTMQETWVRSLGQEDPVEKEMATHSSPLAWKIPWMEEPVGYSPWGRKESDTTERFHLASLDSVGIEPGSPALQADRLPSKPPGKPKIMPYFSVPKPHCKLGWEG